MFYKIHAYNTESLIVWASSEADVDRYIDWLNRDRDVNHYAARAIGETGHDDACILSMDEPHWDDFMSANP